MTRSRLVLAVGPELAAEVERALRSSPVAVRRAADPEEALFELAANPVDCVVVEPAIADGGTPFADAIADRPDLPVVAADPTPTGGVDRRRDRAWWTRLVREVPEAADARSAGDPEARAGGTVRNRAEGTDRDRGGGTDRDRGGGTDGHRAGGEAASVERAVSDGAAGGATAGHRDGTSGISDGGAAGFESSPAPVGPLSLVVEDGTVVDASDQPMPPLGYDPGHLLDTEIAEYVHPDDRETLVALLSGDPDLDVTTLRLEHYDGTQREVWLQRRPEGPDRWRIDVFRRELDRLPEWFPRGEAAEEMLAIIYAHAPVHLYVKDEEGRHVWVSRFHAGDSTEVIGKRDVDFDWGAFAEQTYADDLRVIETGQPVVNREEYVPGRDDWNVTSKVPWFDEDGEVRGLVGVTWRITKRKEYEERLERENERLERFATIVSHDLRNPLGVAIGHLEIAREERDDDHLAAVAGALERMDTITSDLLTMAREGGWVTETERVSLATVARGAWDMVATGDLALEVDGNCAFEGDPDRLHHLFENLYRNAVQHGGDAETVSVGPLSDGFYVADDGVGLPPDELDVLLETEWQSGDGLGLEIVRQVVEAHGWEVDAVESEAGGVRFEVTGVATLE